MFLVSYEVGADFFLFYLNGWTLYKRRNMFLISYELGADFF
jgi:hypothetical protein